MRKIILVLMVVFFVLTVSSGAFATSDNSVVITVSNSLPFSSYQVVPFSYTFKKPIPAHTKFALFYRGRELPLEIVSSNGNTVQFKTVLNLRPLSSEILVLKFGKNLKTNYRKIFLPNFSGTKFVGIGSGNLFIISLKNDNNVKVIENNGNVIFEGALSEKEAKIIPLPNRDTIFSVISDFPVFAEVSSLKPNCLKNSSDDVSSVFGTHFVLYIPKEVVVSSYSPTHIVIKSISGEVIAETTLPQRGQYKNFNLKPGFYEISANNPVTVQFGCEDDNVYAVNYGSLQAFKGVSYGNIVCSALFPNTKVKIKTVSESYPEVNLKSRGDFTYKNLITTFEDNRTEVTPVYITYSNPILIYSDANHGNIGGEQIPSVYGNGKVFSFLTGKIFNFNGLVHRRKVVVISSMPNTSITVNGKKILLKDVLSSKTFLFPKSYTPVNIVSDKPVSVFDIGMSTSIEFLSVLLPVKNENSISVAVGSAGSPPQNNGPGNANSRNSSGKTGISLLSKYLAPVSAFFVGIYSNAQKVPWINNIFSTLREFNSSISPYFKNLSKQIIALFMPASEMVYPYVHQYFPNISKEQLAAIIFYILLVFIVILLIPKRRKKKIPVVKVKEEAELKKKSQVAFNVKTIEEKGAGVKFGAPGKPKTITPKNSEASVKRVSVKETPSPTKKTAPFSRPSIKPPSTTEKSKDLGNRISALYKGPKPAEVPKKQKETGQVNEGVLSKKKIVKIKEVEKPAEEKAISESALEKVEKPSPAESNIVSKEEKPPLKALHTEEKIQEKSSIEKVKPEESKVAQSGTTRTEEKKETRKKESAFSRLFGRKKPSTTADNETKATEKKHIQPATAESIAEEIRRAAEKETSEKQIPVKEKSKEKPISEEAKPAEKEESVKTSLDELLARVQEVREKQKLKENLVKKETINPPVEKVNKSKSEVEPVKSETDTFGKIGIKTTIPLVADKDGIDFLVREELINHVNRIFISAKDQIQIDSEIKEKYRIGVIALTPIELRIAEDLARRIGSNKSTGEVLLIAKKVGVKQVLVNDNPKIREYQGIKILSIKDSAK